MPPNPDAPAPRGTAAAATAPPLRGMRVAIACPTAAHAPGLPNTVAGIVACIVAWKQPPVPALL